MNLTQTLRVQKDFSSGRSSFLHPKIIDPILLPNYIRARVKSKEPQAKSPIRKAQGEFNNFNKVTEEDLFKYTKKRIKQKSAEDVLPEKTIRTYGFVLSDPILQADESFSKKVMRKKEFKPSRELIKFNEDRNKAQKKRSVSRETEKKVERNKTPPAKIKTEMEEVLKSPVKSVENLAVQPQKVPFSTLKQAILEKRFG